MIESESGTSGIAGGLPMINDLLQERDDDEIRNIFNI